MFGEAAPINCPIVTTNRGMREHITCQVIKHSPPNNSTNKITKNWKPLPFVPAAPCPKPIGQTIKTQYTKAHMIEYGISPSN
jgi:hypothetical protein